MDFLHNINLLYWIQTIGYAGLILIIFVETGLFFGFFLPGDSLLFTAGVLAAKSVFDIWVLALVLILTAFIGYMFGYWFGNKLGFWLLKRKKTLFFKPEYLKKGRHFYAKHGGKALIFGRLLPIVRTFIPIVAGMVNMPYKSYIIYNFIGAVVWGGGVTLLGFFLGNLIPDAIDYLLAVIFVIVVISILPTAIHFFKNKKNKVVCSK